MTYLTLRVLPICLMGGAIACSSTPPTSHQPDAPNALIASAPSPIPSSQHSLADVYPDSTMMTATPSPSPHPTVHDITLIAREAAIPAIGEADTPDRPIGFASVFLSIENPVSAEQTLTLESVEVVSLETREVLLSQTEPQSISLMPLENMRFDVQLRNHQGYPDTEQVMAIATYRVTHHPDTEDETPVKYSIDSPVVEVERSPSFNQ